MWDNGGGGGKSVPKLPLTETLYWDAMRAKWPGSAIRYASWLSDDPVITELQNALTQKLVSLGLVPNWAWEQPGKYDLQTMQALWYLGFTSGVMTGSMYDFLGISYSSLYPLPTRPVSDGEPVVQPKNVWYIIAAFGGAFATYQIVTKLIKGKGKRKRR